MKPGTLRKVLLYTGGTLLSVALLSVLALKLALNRVPEYQAQIKEWVHQQTGLRIRFNAVTPALRWYGPELQFSALELRSGDDRRGIAAARRGSIAVDVWTLIADARLLAGRIRLDAPQITVTRLGPGRFSIGEGLEFGEGGSDLRQSLRRLPHGRLDVRGARVTLLQWNPASPTLAFEAVDLDLARRGDRVELQLDTRMPAQLSGVIHLKVGAADFGGEDAMSWNASLHARDVSLPGWHDLLPEFSNAVDSGTARVDLSAGGSGGTDIQARLDFTAYDFRAVGAARNLREVGGVFYLTRREDQWALSGERVRALSGAGEGRATRFTATWQSREGSLNGLQAQFDRLSLDALTPVVAVLPQKSLRDAIGAWDLGGEWSDAQFNYARSTPGAPARWQVRARFASASVAPRDRLPGFKGLSGAFRGDDSGGRLDIDAPGAVVSWPEQWPAPVPFTRLRGTVFWRRDAQRLLVASQNFELSNPDGSAAAKFAWRGSADGQPPQIVLWSGLRDLAVSAAPRYLPRRNIAPRAYEWLSHAFIAGRVPQADFVLRGPWGHFPFRDGSGLFLARFPTQNVVLNFRDDWPRIEELAVQAEFRNQGLTVQVRHARTGQVEVHEASGTFADFKTGELNVQAHAHTDAAAALGYLASTPLDDLAANAFSRVDAAGPVDADVTLFLPFKQFDQRRVLVQAQLDGVSLAYKGSKAAATQLRGSVEVVNAQVPRAQLRGWALGGPLQVRARVPRAKSDLATQLEVHGTASAEGLRAAFDIPAEVLRAGRTEWHGTVRLAPTPRERWVRVSSDLDGLEVGLPEPLAKSTEQRLPFDAQVEWLKGPGPLLHASLSDRARGVLQWDAAGRVERAALRFGTEPAVLSGRARLSISGRAERLDLSGWLALRSTVGISTSGVAASGATSLSELMHDASMSVGELDFHALAFHDLNLTLGVEPQSLRVDVDGPANRGHLVISSGASPWVFDFERLKIEDRVGGAQTRGGTTAQGNAGSGASAGDAASGAQQGATASASNGTARSTTAGSGETVKPDSIPALQFKVAEFAWGAQKIGSVQAALSRIEAGVALDQLKVHGGSFDMEATGRWSGPDQGRGRLEGVLLSHDVQQTLAQFGYAQVMQGKAGRLDFDLNWRGMPSQAAIPSLNGTLKLEASKGQILEINPGAGRVFGLASLASLPRRLSLDFSDLTDKGLAYDVIRGSFDLREGDAYTNNLLLEGPALEIGLIGRVGLAKRDLDQTAAVAGKMGVTLPIASTLAAGPVVGAAVLVFSQLFKQPLKGLVRGYYRITGSWESPQVERVKGDAAAEAQRESQAEHKQ